jgi:hypothetical protein
LARSCLLFCLLAASSLWPAQTARAGSLPGHVASTTWQGLVLTLRVSGAALPRDALVRADVTLTSRSRRPRRAYMGSCDRAADTLTAWVIGRNGLSILPSSALYPPVSCGPPPDQVVVHPGWSIARHLYVVLSAKRVRASVGSVPAALFI